MAYHEKHKTARYQNTPKRLISVQNIVRWEKNVIIQAAMYIKYEVYLF